MCSRLFSRWYRSLCCKKLVHESMQLADLADRLGGRYVAPARTAEPATKHQVLTIKAMDPNDKT